VPQGSRETRGDASVSVNRRQVEVLLDAPHARFQLAYQDAMANYGCMVLHHCATQAAT